MDHAGDGGVALARDGLDRVLDPRAGFAHQVDGAVPTLPKGTDTRDGHVADSQAHAARCR